MARDVGVVDRTGDVWVRLCRDRWRHLNLLVPLASPMATAIRASCDMQSPTKCRASVINARSRITSSAIVNLLPSSASGALTLLWARFIPVEVERACGLWARQCHHTLGKGGGEGTKPLSLCIAAVFCFEEIKNTRTMLPHAPHHTDSACITSEERKDKREARSEKG